MPRLPRLTAGQIIRVLEKTGFVLVRQSGSHKIYRNASGQRVTVPYHAGKILHPKTLQSILREAELSVEALIDLLDS
jgi:predicted RNA binding protein YcfA (HicA-like mRNA interferase family)